VLEISYFKSFREASVYRIEVDDVLQVTVESEGISGPYRLGVGDEIEVVVTAGVVQGPYRILPDGRITLPLLGAVELRGLTIAEARERLAKLYGRHYENPSVDLLVRDAQAGRFTQEVRVLSDGSAALPHVGAVPLRGLTVSEAADLLTREYGRRLEAPRVDILVTKSRERVSDFFELMSSGRSGAIREAAITEDGVLELPLIEPIRPLGRSLQEVRQEIAQAYATALPEVQVTTVLTRRGQRQISVLGEVRRAGVFEAPYRMSAMQAIALAGGLTDRANRSQVIHVHPESDGRLSVRVIDLEKALDMEDPAAWAATVEPYDIVYIPKSAITNVDIFVDQYIRQLIPIGVGAAVGYDVNR
jgi:protein involved in polysaccharide export with SLBB domain